MLLLPPVAASAGATQVSEPQSTTPASGVGSTPGTLDSTIPSTPEVVPPALTLTLRQALDVAYRDSPQADVAHYSEVSASENLNSQRAPINPTIAYSGLNNTVAPVSFANRANYAGYVTLETNGAQHWRYVQAREGLRQAQAEADVTRQTLKQTVISAYVGLQVANITLAQERQAYDTAQQLSDLTAKRFALGASPEADAVRARIARVQEEQNLLAASSQVRIARATLNVAMGRPSDTPIDVAEPLAYRPIPIPDVSALSAAAVSNRPEILAADADAESLKAATKLTHSEYYPDVVLGRDFQRSSPVGLGIVFPVDLGSIHGAVRKSEADQKSQLAQAQLARQNVDLDVRSAYLNLLSARGQVESYRSGILPEAESLLSRVKQGYSLGASTILDLIDAQNTYRTTLNSYNTAIGNYQQALYQLEHSIGASSDASPGATLASLVSSQGQFKNNGSMASPAPKIQSNTGGQRP